MEEDFDVVEGAVEESFEVVGESVLALDDRESIREDGLGRAGEVGG